MSEWKVQVAVYGLPMSLMFCCAVRDLDQPYAGLLLVCVAAWGYFFGVVINGLDGKER